MAEATDAPTRLPGVAKPRRFRPRWHYELIACGLRGHELVGTDAAELRAEDALVARDYDGVRWYRCLRCDSWLPLAPPDRPASEHPPDRQQIELPLRGKPLRDKVVLRVIAVDRALHFLVLALIAALIFLFQANETHLRQEFYSVVTSLQGSLGGPVQNGHKGFLHTLDRAFSLRHSTLTVAGLVALAYALLEGAEAVGLWMAKRWAEYLTFIATTLLLPLEIYELTETVSPFKIIALIINVAIVIYLLLAKRLFGLRGGGAAEEAERAEDVGWDALERATPPTRAAGAGAAA